MILFQIFLDILKIKRRYIELTNMDKEYCTCEDVKGVYSTVGEFGYWDMCSGCSKPLEDGFHYYDEPECY